ncbi:conserved hypothetical protein [Vibrio crassostreae]|uniref:DUF1566 domain-containing protein n=1 Tax=Vibrio crassostreae TaxID=246167 RepID=UPI001B30761D|nr:DUF1566 domain-containing protein [Vibrio crassostreae]CAK1873146.1 conserved hypothetical protein [Vibrio crassostreae]CAK1877596.1 conserved hypothetical protein [Vibrio crassostreae]CAK1887148.1 conserved hypothetical protein [Vibrio crassostreae]CAK1889152.1 conserved hypothetical protein [Vibrio crassostreae]CAK1941335.1 conserved hypothetical protein [Vibrio crassostreae]
MYLFNSDLLKRNSTLNVFTSVSLAVLLAGCGSESNSDGEQGVIASPTESASISAQDIQDNSLVEQSFIIDLTEHVHTSNNQDFVVTNARSLSGDSCQVQGINEGSFNVYSSDVNDCLFEYEVTTSARTSMATSYARVAMGQNYSSTTLPRITASTIESQVVVVDLESELGSSLPNDDFVLQDSTITIGSGTARVSGAHQIEFTPTAKGQTEVYYSYQNGESIQQGSLSIATSEDTYNTAPTAEDFAFSELALLGESIVVDVADYISDVDSDDVQLVGVQDFNSTTALYDPTNLTNTKFEFSSTQPGSHDVAYTVSDHMGGYTTGVARIEVEPDFSLIQDWEDIVTHDPVISSDIRFFAPMTKVYADYVNAPYTGTYIENGTQGLKDAEVVTQTLSQARQYCKVRGGRLPLQRELETLVTNETSAFTNHNWPTSNKYWTAENISETNAATVNLNDGSIGNQSKTVAMYTTCVDLSNPSVSDFSVAPQIISVSGNEYRYQIDVVHPDGDVGAFQDINLESLGGYGVFDSGEFSEKLTVNETGTTEVSYYDMAFNKSVIALGVSSVTELYPFVPDEEASALETTDPTKWNHVDIRYGLPIPQISENGIPILFSYDSPSGMGSSSVYKESFQGNDFVMSLHIRNNGNVTHGVASFFIEQQGNLPDSSWYDVTRTQPGAPMTDDTYNIVTHFFQNEFNLYSGYNNFVGQGYANVQETDIYLWFQKKGDRLYHYSSSTEKRPEKPDFIVPFDWGTIDPNKPYWVGTGGSTYYEDVEAYVVTANFSAYL